MRKKKALPAYGNWISLAPIIRLWCYNAGFLIFAVFSLRFSDPLGLFWGALFIANLSYTLYLHLCRYAYDFRGGKVMSKIQEYALSGIRWSGKGRLLDLGCGSGALTIRCAQRFPFGEVIGLDTWEEGWGYSCGQCIQNAKLEGVENIQFIQGNAARIPYPDESFDAVISNMVFHEVVEQEDKEKLILEAIRVLKKGGSFSFHDIFQNEQVYGNLDILLQQIKEYGVDELHYRGGTEEQSFIPQYLNSPFMLHGLGLLYGKK